MDLNSLRNHLDSWIDSLKEGDKDLLTARLASLVSAFPFTEYEYIMSFLLARNTISFDQYEKLRANYVASNRYIDLYGLAPRIFGEIWGHQHICDLDASFLRPGKSIDPSYAGEYDLWLQGVKVEVKAARASNTKLRGSLLSKALRRDSTERFWMNYQQIKVDVCDVFIFIGVWVDEILYWVLSRDEVKDNPFLSHQHRGGVEYQIGITERNIDDFDEYGVSPSEIKSAVLRKASTR